MEEHEERGGLGDVEKPAKGRPCGKKKKEKESTGGGRERTASGKGTTLKREVVNPV